MKKVLFAVIMSVPVLIMMAGCASNTIEQCPDRKQLEAKIDKARKATETYERGYVIVGRVILDGDGDVRDVNTQMEILPEGYFAGPIRDLSTPIGFRMHQYRPYDLQLKGAKKDKERDLYDVGTIHIKPLSQDELVDFRANVVLKEGGDPSQASIELSAMHGPINTPSNGTEPRRYWPDPVKAAVQESGLAEASGFSPIKYWCRITAPNYLKTDFAIEFKPGQTLDLGMITLEKPRQIKLAYVVSKEPRFDLSNLKTAKMPAGTRWKAVDDIYGWDLEFKQEKGVVLMTYSYAPCYLWRLGNGEIEQYVNMDESLLGPKLKWDHRASNEDVYLLHQGHLERWVLLKIFIE